MIGNRRYSRLDLQIAVENAREVARACRPTWQHRLAGLFLRLAQFTIGKDV